jgi:PAS domain S-box-containing protein
LLFEHFLITAVPVQFCPTGKAGRDYPKQLNQSSFSLLVIEIFPLKRKGTAGPLMCWDFFMESHFRRMQQAESLYQLQNFAERHHWRMDWAISKLLLAEERVTLVTDLAQVIQFATPNMVGMNGYKPDEVIGRKPTMFQGKDTDPETRPHIREAILRRLPFKGNILNYRKDGSPYDCLVEEYPVWNKGGELVHFVAFEKIA